MDFKKLSTFSICILFGSALHAASFNCKMPLNKTEKTICGSAVLSSLDSKLAVAYKKAYAASGSIGRRRLLMAQRSWINHVRVNCDHEECIMIAYQSRIDELVSIAKDGASIDHSESRKVLDFKGLQLGQVLNEKDAHKVFHNFVCRDSQMNRLMSSIEHGSVKMCEGKAVFENQEMDAVIELHGNNRLSGITLCYDTPYPEGGVNSAPVSEMENRLIATYGQPNVLRTESPRQHVHYASKDLLPDSEPLDQGEDLWVFENGATIILGPCSGHQKVDGGHIFSSEGIFFSSEGNVASITLPARHAIPIVLTKLFFDPGNDPQWKPSELMAVEVIPGGKRTCTVGLLTLSATDDYGPRYTTTMACTDFIEIGGTVANSFPPTRVRILRSGREIAVGYIPKLKAEASLEHQ